MNTENLDFDIKIDDNGNPNLINNETQTTELPKSSQVVPPAAFSNNSFKTTWSTYQVEQLKAEVTGVSDISYLQSSLAKLEELFQGCLNIETKNKLIAKGFDENYFFKTYNDCFLNINDNINNVLNNLNDFLQKVAEIDNKKVDDIIAPFTTLALNETALASKETDTLETANSALEYEVNSINDSSSSKSSKKKTSSKTSSSQNKNDAIDMEEHLNDSILIEGVVVGSVTFSNVVNLYEELGSNSIIQSSLTGNYDLVGIFKFNDEYYCKVYDKELNKYYYAKIEAGLNIDSTYQNLLEMNNTTVMLTSTDIGTQNVAMNNKLTDVNTLYFVKEEVENNGLKFAQVINSTDGEEYYLILNDDVKMVSLDSILNPSLNEGGLLDE